MAFDPNAVRSGAVASTNRNYQGAWVVYVNGEEVPAIGWEVDIAVWSVPTFRVHFLPDVLMTRIGAEDRVQVQIFYLDYWWDPTRTDFRLLVDGEIVGWSYSNSLGSRSISYSCAGHLAVFQQLYFYYMTNVDDVVASRSPDIAAQSVATTPGPFYPYGLFHQGLSPTAEQIRAETPGATTEAPNAASDVAPSTPIQAPYEFVTNIIRGCISSQVPDSRRAVPAMNFFAPWIKRTSFHNRWVRLPLLEDPARLAGRTGVFPIFNAARNSEALTAMQRHAAAQVGNAGNVWNLMQQVLSLVHMEIGTIPNACAALVMLKDETGGSGSNPVDGRILGALDYSTPVEDQRSLERMLGPDPDSTPYRPPPLRDEATFYDAPRVGDGVALPRPTEGGTTMGVSRFTPIRLCQHFVKPQGFFWQPPACNVIFPSMIKNYGINEDYAAQPTRVYVNDSVMTQALRADAGANREFMLHALTVGYPEEANALLHHHAGNNTDGSIPTETGKNLLIWPEEFFRGPVTARMTLPAWFQMLRQFSNAQAGAGPNAAGTSEAPQLQGTPVQVNEAVTQSLSSTNSAPGQTVQPGLPLPRRGGVASRTPQWRAEEQPGYPYRWIPPESTLTKGATQNTTYTSVRKVATVRNPRTEQSVDDVEPYAGTVALRNFLIQRFPDVFNTHNDNTTIGMKRPVSMRTPIALTHVVDDHRAGMAMDLMIPPIHGRPHLEVGARVANWLIENAQALGIAFIVYARSIWAGSDAFGRRMGARTSARFRHYTVPGEGMDHFDHIHITLTRDAAFGGGAGITNRGQTLLPPSDAPVNVVRRPLPQRPAQPGTAAGNPGAGASTEAAPGTPEEGDTFAHLFELYAQVEYLRQRYAARPGAVDLEFNPYLIVGFPCVVFDTMATQIHTVGYVQRISHRAVISQGSANMSTSMQMAFTRNFYEFVADVRADAQRFGARVTTAPAEVIPEIREVMQDEANAETFYRALLYGNRALSPVQIDSPQAVPADLGVGARQRKAAFVWTDALGYAVSGRTDPVILEGPSAAEAVAQDRAAARAAAPQAEAPPTTTPTAPATVPASTAPTERVVRDNLDPDRELSPRENGYAEAWLSYDVAMQYAARPCCTLDEYIRFWHAGKDVGALQTPATQGGVAQVGQNRTDYSYVSEIVSDVVKGTYGPNGRVQLLRGQRVRYPGTFYDHIFQLRPGPGTPPSDEQRGYSVGATIEPVAQTAGIPATYAQTRADWSVALRRYREKIRSQVRPST